MANNWGMNKKKQKEWAKQQTKFREQTNKQTFETIGNSFITEATKELANYKNTKDNVKIQLDLKSNEIKFSGDISYIVFLEEILLPRILEEKPEFSTLKLGDSRFEEPLDQCFVKIVNSSITDLANLSSLSNK